MKLFVDDIRTPPNDTWHICRTVISAIKALDMFWSTVEEISLDHDISHQVVMGGMSRPYPCDETFEVVAICIAQIKKLNPSWAPKIEIHTSNYTGARNMRVRLEDAGFKDVTSVIEKGANRLETIL